MTSEPDISNSAFVVVFSLSNVAVSDRSGRGRRNQSQPQQRDAQHDFDFEFGAWKAHISRRLKPLTGSTNWVEYEGTSIVRKVWNGRANLGELEVSGPSGQIQGLSLRTL